MMTKNLTILGSTGSIGRQTLEVVEQLPVRVAALTAGQNVERMAEQCRRFRPQLAVMGTEEAAQRLREALAGEKIEIRSGMDGLIAAAEHPLADTVVTAVVGMLGLRPTLAAIRAKKRIALANKETLVCAGELVMREAAAAGAEIVPVDSEHSAIFQCLMGCRDRSEIRRLILTCSGGPFFGKTPDKLRNPSDLQVRFRTGVIYTAVTVICVLAGNIPMVLMLMVVAGICAGEFFYMLRSDAKLPNEMLGIIAAVLYPLSVYIAGLVGAMLVSLALLLALLVWYVFWLRARIPDVGVSFFGAAYTGLLLCGLVIIRVSLPAPWGGVCVLLLFLSVWANDAFAYLVGSKIGRHKLAPRTSPKKSWEGFIAGLVGSVIFWCLMTLVPGITMAIPQAIVFGIISGCMGVLGDLAESRIKRNSGFKDSGTIMPGHGGLLDRSDSLFLTSITAAILLIAGGCIPYALF